MQKINNPVGTNGFAFIEFACHDTCALASDVIALGFTHVATHKHKPITLYRQGHINFLLNGSQTAYVATFAKRHGNSAMGIGFRIKDPDVAKKYVITKGAEEFNNGQNELSLPAIKGAADSVIYFMEEATVDAYFEENFLFVKNKDSSPAGVGLQYIDHLTYNVQQGQMDTWADFLQDAFNFQQIKFFHIQGKMTGLLSRAMVSPCGKIRIPINEATDDKSQIAEFIQQFHGEGIQHIALGTDDIYRDVALLRANGVQFLDTPNAYFDLIQERLPWQHEPIEKLRALKILIDGEPNKEKGLLLQIFTETMLGPVFFEIIQRKGNEGFGEGNFQALFEAIEREQLLRDVI